MKKHLIAAAVAGALAVPAMAQVTVYGVIDQGYTSTEEKNTETVSGVSTSEATKTATSGNGSAYSSQRLGFKGSEDLDGGMKAFFVYEIGLGDRDGADSGKDIWADTVRQLNLGISGGFGAIKLGRMGTQADASLGAGDVGGGNNFIGRLYTSGLKLNNSRSDRLIEYTTPTMSGLKVAVQYGTRKVDESATGTATSTTSHKETGVGVSYSAGPLNVKLGYVSEKVKTAGVKGSDPEQISLGANYNLGMAKVFFLYMDGETSDSNFDLLDGATKTNTKGMEIGAAIPLGKLTAQVSYFDAEGKEKLNTTSVKGDLDGFQIAALYALSKRTTAYAVYGSQDAKVRESATTTYKSDTEVMGFGIRHKF
jgi:predicted porin